MSSNRSYQNGTSNANANSNSNYLNGSEAHSRLGRFNFDTTPDTSADERSRSRDPPRHGGGGYGGFQQPQQQQQQQQVQAPTHLGRQQAHRRSQDYSSPSRSRSRPAALQRNGTTPGNQVEDILRHISTQYPSLATSECIPVKLALQLMDTSSLGLYDRADDFSRTHQQLQSAPKQIVNEHHQGFNSSIGTFHKITSAIQGSQQKVRTLRTGLEKAKGTLGSGGAGTGAGGRPEVRALAASSQSYEAMLVLLKQIEQLQLVPELLEAQVSEKRFLSAVQTLQDALKLLRGTELESIGALADLRVYLSNQEVGVTDILVEELCAHLFLKSPYCEERWRSLLKPSSSSTTPEDTASRELDNDEDARQAMHTFLSALHDTTGPLREDPARNPEADTFSYIHLLVESLHRMDRLDVAVEAIEQRLPVELFRVVEKSHREVETRHATSTLRLPSKLTQNSDVVSADRSATLNDLLATLYARFEAIAESFRVLHDVTAAISKRAGPDTSSPLDRPDPNRSFHSLWQLLQSNIRSLLHDHLASSTSLDASRRHSNDPSANIFRPRPRDKSRRLFRLAETLDTSAKSSELATEREDLEFILKASVPGLVGTAAATRTPLQAERAEADTGATGHKLLVEASVFNMAVLLPPSIAFLHRLRAIVPAQGSGVVPSTLTTFLDDFLINVFYPQLEESLTLLCGQAVNDLEAFQPTTANTEYPRPVFTGTIRFWTVLSRVCALLDALPHEQAFSGLVVAQMRGYYDRCFQWSKSLLQRSLLEGDNTAQMRLAAELATSGDVNDVVIALLNAQKAGHVQDGAVLAEKESALLIQTIRTRGTLDEAELITDRKALAQLCTLHVSMTWLAQRCKSLRFVSTRAVDMMNAPSPIQPAFETKTARKRRPNGHWSMRDDDVVPEGIYLPLDEHMAIQFDAVRTSFTELSTLILRTLHLDLRLQVLLGLSTSLSHTYALGQEYRDPDPATLLLSENLSTYSTVLSVQLPVLQTQFLTTGLDVLVANTLCALTSLMPALDSWGLQRMQTNILVLQQSLNSFTSTGSGLERARRFFELGGRGVETIVVEGLREGYAKEDLRALARLCYEVERDGENVDGLVARLS